MFQAHSFSGSSRRPRQVDLSGRPQNPFARGPGGGGHAGGGGLGGLAHAGHAGPPARASALASAHQDRLHRQLERDRAKAALLLQRAWRGHTVRRAVGDARRRAWDDVEAGPAGPLSESGQSTAYDTDSLALEQLEGLLAFASLEQDRDFARLRHWQRRWALNGQTPDKPSQPPNGWPLAYLRLERACIRAAYRVRPPLLGELLQMLHFVSSRAVRQTAQLAPEYYKLLAHLLATAHAQLVTDEVILLPLKDTSQAVIVAYESLALHILTLNLSQLGLGLGFVSELNISLLGRALADLIVERQPVARLDRDARVWLLGHFIHIHRLAHNFERPHRFASAPDFVLTVGYLLSSLVDEIQVEASFDTDDVSPSALREHQVKLIDPFVREQIASLVDQDSVGGLLNLMGASETSTHTRVLASYVLTLLRLFPRRGDEIRMWLYLGVKDSQASGRPAVIRFFWQAASASDVYKAISKDSRAAIDLLRPRDGPSIESVNDQWRELLMFFELYTFVLKVMDDEEFFSDGQSSSSRSLNLNDVASFTIFLKNLGFTMYYNAPEIVGAEEMQPEDISQLFKAQPTKMETPKGDANHIAGIQGVSLDYLKGLVTGLLRQLYARDSRRPFLPRDHWLMSSRFDMTYFIDAVVEEEERRHRVQQQDDEDEGDGPGNEPDDEASTPSRLVGVGRAQQNIRAEQYQRQQRKASRKRYLQAVAPRLEILQNMPFMIPFRTRVQIFRKFVALDQLKRRAGFVDGEMWRLSQMGMPERLERHSAKIRREHEFEDAYEQFFELGAGLKEPIQITFVDRFDTVEAGIDGGGVTKEFLTSVTNQAFAPKQGLKMFVENDQHLLYPNPSALEEQKELLREVGFREDSPTFRAKVVDLLSQYEFLGRVIGKCLYEGILVDIGFAGFFLLKWALTGGQGAAPRETGYRPSINDLRDLDEALYQGLLQLKNYPGNVEEDFGLSFIVTDEVVVPGSNVSKPITRDLRPNGHAMPVTNANRLVYIADMARHRLQSQPYHQTNAFLKGLASIIEPSWLSMFNQMELQTLVGGAASSINIADLRSNTIYGGVYVIGDDGLEHPSVALFWDVMESLPDPDRRKVLKFVTSTPRAPLLGFASLNPKFCIRDAGDDEARLPSTSTCVNLLKLPRYSTAPLLRHKLLQAVNSGAGFDLS